MPGMPKALPSTTLAVLRPTPGSVTRSFSRPRHLAVEALARARRRADQRVGLGAEEAGRLDDRLQLARGRRRRSRRPSGYCANSVGVTMLTLSSVRLRREDRRDQQLERGLEVELAVRVGVALREERGTSAGRDGSGRAGDSSAGRRRGAPAQPTALAPWSAGRCGRDSCRAEPWRGTVHTDVCWARPRCSPPSTARAPRRADDERSSRRRCPSAADVLFHEGDQGDRLYVIGEGKIKLGRTRSRRPREPRRDPRPGRDVRRAVACSTRARAPRPPPPSPRRRWLGLGHDDLTACSTGRPEVAKHLLRRPRPAAAPHQRGPRRPGLHRRAGPCGQGAARPRRAASAARSRTACSSPTTSPRRSWPSSSAPPARRSTRPSPTSRTRGWLRLEARAVLLHGRRAAQAPRRAEPSVRYSSWARTASAAAGHTSRGTSA